MGHPQCKECHRALRPSKAKVAEHPGTVEHYGQGYCRKCWRREQPKKARIERPDNCLTCEREMRPKHTTLQDRPGTVLHKSYGKCRTCYDRVQREGQVLDTSDDVQDFTPKHVPGVSAEMEMLRAEREKRKRAAALRDARIAQASAQRAFTPPRRAA